MCKENHKEKPVIHSEMIVLDIVAAYKKTLPVFKKYDEFAGECICCNSLFETLKHVSDTYGINLEKLKKDLQEAIIKDIKSDA